MIQRDYVKAWSVEYPWRYSEMVEQDLILCCWRTCRELVHEEPVSKKNFIQNMEAKLRDPDYLSDMEAFLRPGTAFDPKSAWADVRSRLVDALG